MALLRRELHTTDRPSATAQWTTMGRALELGRPELDRILSDRYAPAFLTAASRRLLRPLQLGGPAVRLAERSTLAGLAASGLCRHRFIDEHLLEALPDLDQVLILGAGYDSRAWRFTRSIGRRPVYEVDLAPLSRRKAAIVAADETLFGHAAVHRVEIDFRTQTLADVLHAAGFVAGIPTFVVWEGVSMYLTRDAVTDTLQSLARVTGPGSVLAMDYWRRVPGLSPYDTLRRVGVHAMPLIGEPITFSIGADAATALLAETGFDVLDLALADEMTGRYATGGRRCDSGMYVVAAELR